MDVIAKHKVADAWDLLQFLLKLQSEGRDLSTIYVLDRDGADAEEVALFKSRLTDGSTVNDLRIYFQKS